MGMIGRCPTVDIVMNGRKVRGLIDTGSEVTTVIERWVRNSDLLPMAHGMNPSGTRVTIHLVVCLSGSAVTIISLILFS